MEDYKSKVYIKIDERNRVIQLDGGYSIANIKNFDEWIFIDEGTGDKYNLCQSHYLEKSIMEDRGIPRYKYEDNKIVERTQEEIDADYVPSVQQEVQELKAYLDSTDYIYPKCIETGEDVNVVYAEIIEKRKQARARIQELEN